MNLIDMTIETVRNVLMLNKEISEAMIADVVDILLEKKVAIDRNMQVMQQIAPVAIEPLKKAIKPREAAKLLGIGVKTLEYHARHGRINRVMPQGAKRSMGYVYDDIFAMLQGKNSLHAA